MKFLTQVFTLMVLAFQGKVVHWQSVQSLNGVDSAKKKISSFLFCRASRDLCVIVLNKNKKFSITNRTNIENNKTRETKAQIEPYPYMFAGISLHVSLTRSDLHFFFYNGQLSVLLLKQRRKKGFANTTMQLAGM